MKQLQENIKTFIDERLNNNFRRLVKSKKYSEKRKNFIFQKKCLKNSEIFKINYFIKNYKRLTSWALEIVLIYFLSKR